MFIAAITLNGLVGFVVFILILAAICWLLTWLIDYLAVPAPFGRVAKGFIMVVGVFLLIYVLLGFAGVGGVSPVIRIGN